MRPSPCPNCDSKDLFKAVKPISSGGGYAPNYLPGIGGSFSSAKFDVVVCHNCGLTRWFAGREYVSKLSTSKKWERLY
jgi:DNA-directed RNA polymerase subunit RPC12/RpoP